MPAARALPPLADVGHAGAVAGPARPAAGPAARRYAVAVGSVVLAHLLLLATWRHIGPAITSVFLTAVIIASLY
ncbi:MAG TPA: hypothetical protein VF796_03955, partial [Humisphaera sp.]